MTFKEQIEAKQAELDALKDRVEADDADAIKDAEAIMAELDELNEKAEQAETKKAALARMGSETPKTAADETAKNLGEYAVKNLDVSAIRNGSAKNAGTDYGYMRGSKAATDLHTAPSIVVTDTNIVENRRPLSLRDLFGAERISGNAISYYVETATEGAPAEVAEGALKPQFHMGYEPATATLQKIAGWFYETDELLEDAEFMASAINNRGLYELDLAVEKYLADKLLNTSGIGSVAEAPSADSIFKAMTAVQTASGHVADAVVINPVDYQTIRLSKDQAGQYLGGGAFFAPYGNGDVVAQPGLWGLNTIVSTAVEQGTAIVGAFRTAASVYSKANAGARIEVFVGDHDDAVNNRVTVVVEERLELVTRIPSAFVEVKAG